MDKHESKPDRKERKEIKHLEEKINELEEFLASVVTEKDELFAKLQRVSADYVNYQKRVPRQIADSVAYEKEKFVKAMLGSIDNFEHALANSDKAESLESFVKGVQIVYDEILNTLKGQGVERIASVGQQFDPSHHEALMQKTEDGKVNGEILEEYLKGYKLHDRVIRPARVVVNKVAVPQEPQQDAEQQKDTEPQKESDSDSQE
jgi:molecular chaperone GrpE